MTSSDLLRCYNLIEGHKYIIVEGFEKTGKSTLINNLVQHSNGKLQAWSFDYHSESSNLGNVPYNSRYLLGVSLNDALLKGIVQFTKPTLVDRGFISGLVYSELYHQENSVHLDWYRQHYVQIFKDLDIIVLYLTHLDRKNAIIKYNSAEIEESYDQFANFESYWSTYLKADFLYRKYLKLVNYYQISLSSF